MRTDKYEVVERDQFKMVVAKFMDHIERRFGNVDEWRLLVDGSDWVDCSVVVVLGDRDDPFCVHYEFRYRVVDGHLGNVVYFWHRAIEVIELGR